MSRVLAILAWLIVLALQVTLWPQITLAFRPSFALAAALAVGLTSSTPVTGPARARVGSSGNLWAGFWLATGSGAVLDLYAQHHFGLLTIAGAVGYAMVWLVVRPPVDDLGWPSKLGAALLAATVYELIVVSVFKLTVPHFPFLAELATVGTLDVLGTVTAFALFAGLLGAVRRRFG